MATDEMTFPDSVHIITRRDQTLVLNARTRKWVILSTAGFDAVRRYVTGSLAATTSISRDVIKRTAEFLLREDFLVRDRAPQSSEAEAERNAPKRPATKSLQLHVTHKCNLSCTTCYVADFLLKGPDLLTVKDIASILEVASANGFQSLTITGGEPLMRTDIFKVLEIARPLFSLVTLNTNGIILTEPICGALKDLTDTINVSIDGASAEVHDRIRGAGAFDKTLKGLDTLRRSGYSMNRVNLAPTVTRLNHENLEAVLDIADSFGAAASFGFFTPTG
ncbi:MAG TPA: radical SAM protein, partial [Blastocatellia bacterium]|nr:radical SAM protein [Blastocatellia bacterium]